MKLHFQAGFSRKARGDLIVLPALKVLVLIGVGR